MASQARWNFVKVEGLGNDFIVLGGPEEAAPPVTEAEAIALCDRRRGIGGDGVLLLGPAEGADLRMEVINSDGSRPEMCGNGLRCVVRLWAPRGARLQVATAAGLREGEHGHDGRIRTDMGELRCTHPEIDLGEHGRAVGWSAGNPHLILIRAGDIEALADAQGARWTHHPAFPNGVNVGFWAPDAEGWRGIVQERGAGRTLACGTGAAAAAAEIMRQRGGGSDRLALRLPGGPLEAEVDSVGDRARVALIGTAQVRFEGCWPLTAQRL